MAILIPGSDVTLAPAIRALVRPSGGSVRQAVNQIVASGFVAAQLDATLTGLRPRDLDDRARKDLHALLSRRGVQLAGFDMFVPRKHYIDAHHVDRAMSATLAGITLAADLGRVPVSVALPVERMPADALAALVESADGHGVTLAVHAEDQIELLCRWLKEVDLPALGGAIDPAALMCLGKDPSRVVEQLGSHLAVARLNDVNVPSTSDEAPNLIAPRAVVGGGDLDLTAYRVALELGSTAEHGGARFGRAGPVVLDLLHLPEPTNAAQCARTAWDDAVKPS